MLCCVVFQNACPPVGDSLGEVHGRLLWQPIKLSDVKWNFEKFLVGPNGKPVKRWYSGVEVSVVRRDVVAYLRQIYGQTATN